MADGFKFIDSKMPPFRCPVNPVNFTKAWYRGIYIPRLRFESAHLIADLVRRSIVLARDSIREYRDELRIDVASYGACMIRERRKRDEEEDVLSRIVIPFWYFDVKRLKAKHSDMYDPDPIWTALTLINGSTLHESRHVEYSPDTIDLVAKAGLEEARERVLTSLLPILYQICQIVEDNFIESIDTGRPTYRFIQDKNRILFPPVEAQSILDEFTLSLAIVETTFKEGIDKFDEGSLEEFAKFVNDFLNVLVLSKNRDYDDHPMWRTHRLVGLSFDLLRDARNPDLDVGQRGAIALKIFRLLEEFIPRRCMEQAAEKLQSEIEAVLKILMFSFGGPESILTDPGSDEDENDPLSSVYVAIEVARALKKMQDEKDEKVKVPTYFLNIDVQSHEVWFNFHDYSEEMRVVADAVRFSEKISRPGGPLRSGPRLIKHRLYRAPFDPFVFSRRTEILHVLPEVILLIDGSGSMKSRTVGKRTLLSDSVSAGYHLYQALAGTPRSVFIHSSPDTGAQCRIFPLASENMRHENIHPADAERRFRMALGIHAHENFDGYAIQEMPQFFTGSLNDKLLIVISDGEPSGPGYRGSEAIKHTREAVQAVRRQGIDVVALSLTYSALKTNNKIYGRENNIDVTNIDSLPGSLATVFTNELR